MDKETKTVMEEIMLIKNQADLDTFKKMYGIDDEIEKEY